MTRKSFQHKLRVVNQNGTLRTYSREEAITYYMITFAQDKETREELVRSTNKAYDRNLILCHYKAYPHLEEQQDIPEVLQLTTSLVDFVDNIAFPILN